MAEIYLHARQIGNLSKVSDRVLLLALILVVLQILDAVLTTLGLSLRGGIASEGNGLLRYGMSIVGIVPALVVAKSVAVLFILMLCQLSVRVKWIELALWGLVSVYLTLAVIPWSFIILSHF